MADFRKERIKELVMQMASNYITREANHNSLITVTNAEISPDSKYMTIFVSVLPDSMEKVAMDFLKRQRSEFKHHIKTNSKLSPIPFIDFELDMGEKHRQKIDEISKNL